MQLPPVSMIRQEMSELYKHVKMVSVSEILAHYGVEYSQVMTLYRGKVVPPTAMIDVTKQDWAMVSLTIGG